MTQSRVSLSDADLNILVQEEVSHSRNANSIILVFDPGSIDFVGFGTVYIPNLTRKFAPAVFQAFCGVLGSLASAGRLAAVTLKEYVWSLEDFSASLNISVFTIQALDEYREYLSITRSRSFYAVKRFLTHWYTLGYPEVSAEVYEYLIFSPGTHIEQARGRKIRSSDPEEGWYSDQEYEDLISVYWDEYDAGEATLGATTARLLTAQYARRPIQLAHLKICDIHVDGESYGVVGPRIEFPGAKSRDGGFRAGNVETHPLSGDLLGLCNSQAQATIDFFEDYYKVKLTEECRGVLPLFLPRQLIVFERCMGRAHKFEDPKNKLGSRYLHVDPGEMSRVLIRIVGRPVISNRTGKELVEGAYRYALYTAETTCALRTKSSCANFLDGS